MTKLLLRLLSPDPTHLSHYKTLQTFVGPVQLCFSVEQHVGTLFALKLLLYVRLPDGGHSGVIKVKPVATLLTDRKTSQ